MNLEDENNIHLYLYIDLDLDENELELVKKCIYLHLQAYHKKDYNISQIICCNDIVDKTCTEDVIKNGLLTFHNMFKRLKLKCKNQIWFLYLSNGDIQNIHINNCVLLLNTQPNKKECFYIINKNPFILKGLLKDDKIIQFKNLNKHLQQLFIQIKDDDAKKIFY